MLNIQDVKRQINDIISKYPIKKMSIFGSYADGTATEDSDLDILVEFLSSNISLFTLYTIKEEIEARVGKKVDLIHYPIDPDSYIKIDKVVDIYEQ
ncbi:MAG: nucleotidyltransferase domain-containing protein [Lutispora sp.]|nr:nucleotidyltransferase domain-containing protein [Lutispora sp.]MDD4834341.1 nucleotidyltransferase domain-containing protein [Lutispora sp.]